MLPQAEGRAASFELYMTIERQTLGPSWPALHHQDSFSGPSYFDDLERSVEDIGQWDISAQQLLQQARNGANNNTPRDASFGPARQVGYLQAMAPRPTPHLPRRSYSAVLAGVPREQSVDTTTPEVKAHRLGLDSHGRMIASHVQASADALIAHYGPSTDVEASIASLNTYIDTYASRWPNGPLAHRQANGAASPIDNARAFCRSKARYALQHKDNAHYYLAGNKGEPPGFHMRRMCAIVWHCAESWSDPRAAVSQTQGRQILKEAIARALADFTLEASVSREFRCTIGQLSLLMRALQGWFQEVRVDLVEPSGGHLLQPPTANEFLLLFCYNLEVSSRSTELTNTMLAAKAADAIAQVRKLYANRSDCDAMLCEVSRQIRDYYAITYDMAWG
jgi:hypothetical protein